jgi:hypothetical protein
MDAAPAVDCLTVTVFLLQVYGYNSWRREVIKEHQELICGGSSFGCPLSDVFYSLRNAGTRLDDIRYRRLPPAWHYSPSQPVICHSSRKAALGIDQATPTDGTKLEVSCLVYITNLQRLESWGEVKLSWSTFQVRPWRVGCQGTSNYWYWRKAGLGMG